MKIFLITFLTILTIQADLENLSIPCKLCHEIIAEYQKSIPARPAEIILNFLSYKYCVNKKIEKPSVCKDAVRQMTHSILTSTWRHYTDPHSLCHKLKLCPQQYKFRNLTEDINRILQEKPNKQWQTPTHKKLFKVMHISDPHIDMYYTEGAPIKCSEPMCCRSTVTKEMNQKDIQNKLLNGQHLKVEKQSAEPANYWGSYGQCDLPFQTFDLFLKQLKQMNDIDLILWTGDNTPHDVWKQSQSYNLNYTFIQSQRIRKTTNVRVVPTMGNHQSYPVNVYDYQGQRQKVLVGGMAQAWKPWLDQKAYEQVKINGFYSITVPQLNNIKILALNTQAQNNKNWYLLRNPTDPGHMLEWIKKQLKESQQNNQYVWIIGHICPGNAMNDWSMRFNALTERYSYIIRGQFYGHSHTDHIGFFPQYKNYSRIHNYFFRAPSLTTRTAKNPQYRIMTVDAETMEVVNYDQYRLDISKYTKKEDNAKFQLFYNFKQAYKLDDLTIRGGMTQLRRKLTQDNDTQITYTYLRSSGVEKGHTGHDVICDTQSSPQYAAQCRNHSMKVTNFDKVAGNWKDLQHI